MKKLFDGRCPQGHVNEFWGELDETQVCPDCGGDATRIITPVRFVLEGASGHFPTATQRWIKEHESRGGPEEE